MGKGSSGAKQIVNRYFMSCHFGIAAALDGITDIFVGEKSAWTGRVTAEGSIPINMQNLFGGDKKEGGVQGIAYYLPGGPTQVLPDDLAARRGLTGSTHPAYRGLSSIYFVGQLASSVTTALGNVLLAGRSRTGFYWGATPYLQQVWIRGWRSPKGLDSAYAMIGNRLRVSLTGYAVTISETTVTVTDGRTTTVGAHSVNVSVANVTHVKTIVIDGLTIVIQPWVDDGYGNHLSGTTVSVESSTGVLAHGSIRLAGVEVNINGATTTVAMGNDGQDANPAHIIYECMTDDKFGMGESTALMDIEGFQACGVTLYHEAFGMSLQWTRESPIEDFIKEILDHIQATVYIDAESGKWTMKLFRDDYNETTLPLITSDNAVLDNFQRKLWGETVNEISVTWTNPVNEQEETVTQQDLGNIVAQGATVSGSRNYYGVRRAELAQQLAVRDVQQSAAPLASMDAMLDRTMWDLRPGSVVRVTWPEYEIENMVARVMNLDPGNVGAPEIVVSLLEDIFEFNDGGAGTPASSGFGADAADPVALDHVRIITAPAYLTSRRFDTTNLHYPEVYAAVLAGTSQASATAYEMVGQVALPNSTIASQERGTRGLLGYATLQTALVEEDASVVATFGAITNGTGPNVAGLVFIGDGTERTMEIALIYSVADAGWTLWRGVLDTVPRAWPVGTSIWFFDVRNEFFDTAIHSDGETASYKLLAITAKAKMPVDTAAVTAAVLTARPHLPNRPANVKINGVAFGPVDVSGLGLTTIPIAWSNRNRTMEDSVILKWSDATVTPESGQTTTIQVTKTSDGAVLATYSGISGTMYSLPVSAFGAEVDGDVSIWSERDGLVSLQTVVRRVRVGSSSTPVGTPGIPTDIPPVYTGTFPPEWFHIDFGFLSSI